MSRKSGIDLGLGKKQSREQGQARLTLVYLDLARRVALVEHGDDTGPLYLLIVKTGEETQIKFRTLQKK
jgi:hypothetical protein